MLLRDGLPSVAVLAAIAPTTADARLTRLIIERRERLAPASPGAPADEILTDYYNGELDAAASVLNAALR